MDEIEENPRSPVKFDGNYFIYLPLEVANSFDIAEGDQVEWVPLEEEGKYEIKVIQNDEI